MGVGDGASDSGYDNVGYATFADYRDRNRSFERLVAVRSWQTTLVTSEAERVAGMRVSWNYFDMLGVRPALGRTFRKEDDHKEGWRVLVLSDGLWRRRFNADPAVIGRTLRMNDQQYEIVGVMPAGFDDVISATLLQAGGIVGGARVRTIAPVRLSQLPASESVRSAAPGRDREAGDRRSGGRPCGAGAPVAGRIRPERAHRDRVPCRTPYRVPSRSRSTCCSRRWASSC